MNALRRDPQALQAHLHSMEARLHPRCLMCGSVNPLGLRLMFTVQNHGVVVAEFACNEIFQGYPDRVHGGVISALLDATMTNALFSAGIEAVTAELTVRFVAPVALNRRARIRATLDDDRSHAVRHVRAEMEQGRKVVARGAARFFALPSPPRPRSPA